MTQPASKNEGVTPTGEVCEICGRMDSNHLHDLKHKTPTGEKCPRMPATWPGTQEDFEKWYLSQGKNPPTATGDEKLRELKSRVSSHSQTFNTQGITGIAQLSAFTWVLQEIDRLLERK